MAKTATATLNTAYLVADNQGPSNPWIQATEYRPRNIKEAVGICLPEGSTDLLAEGWDEGAEIDRVDVSWDASNPETATVVKNARWVILSRPKTIYAQNKADGSIIKIFKGLKFGNEWKSVCRLHLAMVIGDRIVTDENGLPQVFFMKLSGLKSQWVNGKNIDRSIENMNVSLCKHYKVKGWLTHLVSTKIAAFPRVFTSSQGGEDSLATMFGFAEGDNAKPLNDQQQKTIFELVSTDEFKDMASDPFGLDRVEQPAVEQAHSDDGTMPMDEYDSIEF